MAKNEGFYQSSNKLAAECKDVRISILAHKILYRWNTSQSKRKDGFLFIRDSELANTVFVSTRTIGKYVDKLEKIGFIITKREMGLKYYKVNTRTAKKYYSF